MRGCLHNDPREDSHKKCTFKELQASIEWYKEAIRQASRTIYKGWVIRLNENFQVLLAERTNRFDKALEEYYVRRRRNR